MKYFSAILLLLLLQNLTVLAYKASVLEFHSSTDGDSPEDIMKRNLDEYRAHLENARKQGVQIAVFPEYGLTSLVDDPSGYAIFINDEETIIKELKALAIAHAMYLVVNLLEKEQEPNKATKYYNTNLVFKPNGEIILKYRKINLYMEDKLTPGDANQTVTFRADFGVTFGIFTCYDILWENPSRRVLENSEVTDIVFPTAWSSIMPFFISLSVQHGYALSNGVNLLAANHGDPKKGFGGSGIYLGDGAILETYIGDTPSSKPIVKEITKSVRVSKTECPKRTPFGLPGEVNRSNVLNYNTVKSFHSENYQFQEVDLSNKESNYTICHKEFCCDFRIILAQTDTSDHYKLMAFNGIERVDNKDRHLRVCSLLACKDDSKASCGERVNTTTVFTRIEINGNHIKEAGTFYTPVSLNTELHSIEKVTYCENPDNNLSHIEFSTVQKQKDLLVFGLVGITPSSASLIQSLGMGFLVAMYFTRSLFI